MRTTLDLPDELYRTLKARAALKGITLKALIRTILERGLNSIDQPDPHPSRGAPPVIIPATGVPLPILTREEMRGIEEEEDLEKLA